MDVKQCRLLALVKGALLPPHSDKVIVIGGKRPPDIGWRVPIHTLQHQSRGLVCAVCSATSIGSFCRSPDGVFALALILPILPLFPLLFSLTVRICNIRPALSEVS